MNNLKLVGCVLCLVVLAGGSASYGQTLYEPAAHATTQEEAKEDQLINELFVGEKIYIQDKGELVFILSPSFTKAKDAKELELSGEVKYGVTDRLQISAEVPFSLVNPNQGHQEGGLSDVSVGVNYNFIQAEAYALGVRSEVVFPTGSERRGLGGGEYVLIPSLLSSVRVGKGEVYAGIGAEIGENQDSFVYSLAGAYPWQRFVGVLELTGTAGDDDDTLYLAPGAYFHLRDHVDVGFGVPIGLTHDSDNYALVAKFVFEF